MFTHQTILSLRVLGPGVRMAPVSGHFRDLHFVRNVMEAKQYLLRCVRGMSCTHGCMPDVIVVDAGANNPDIKVELERWMEAHPRLDQVQIRFPARLWWIRRLWKRWVRGEGITATGG